MESFTGYRGKKLGAVANPYDLFAWEPDCIYHLARRAFLGQRGFRRYEDTKKTMALVKTAREKGETIATESISVRAHSDALYLFWIAAEKGSKRAKYVLRILCNPETGKPYNSYQVIRTLLTEVENPAVRGFEYQMSLIVLGWHMEIGLGCMVDFSEAKELYMMASRLGNVDGALEQYRMWQSYLDLPLSSRNVERIVTAARNGDILSHFTYGLMLWHGHSDVTKNPAEAIRIIEYVSKSGLAEAQFTLAMMMKSNTDGTQNDLARSNNLLRSAAAAGYVDFDPGTPPGHWGSSDDGGGEYSEWSSGKSGRSSHLETRRTPTTVYSSECSGAMEEGQSEYEKALEAYWGIERKQSLKEAAQLFRESADFGYTNAMWRLGWCYEYGHGLEQSLEQAFEWYKKSSDAGNAIGTFYFAECYKRGFRGKDLARAKDLFAKAIPRLQKMAEDGDGHAMNVFGQCYFAGLGVEECDEKALELFRQSDEADCPEGTYWRGKFLYTGYSEIALEQKEAVEYFEEAAEAGDVEALKMLIICYANGTGVSRDPERASELRDEYEEIMRS